jgi:transcriptional regulator with XRE-family HTH domain
MMSPQQCRAARGLLQFTQADLAAQACIARKTLCDFESERRPVQRRTLRAIEETLIAAGVIFIEGDAAYGEGVRLTTARLNGTVPHAAFGRAAL